MSRSKDKHSDAQSVVVEALKHATTDRRTFVLLGGAALAAATGLVTVPRLFLTYDDRTAASALFSVEQLEALSAVQEHLFPSASDSPGAADIYAAAYLEAAITTPDFDPDTRHTIVSGVSRLQLASRERYETLFHGLDVEKREQLLRYLADETRWGRVWLSLLLTYIFEALLSDPVYGSNPDESGWQWLEHQPGFPRPPVDKVHRKS